MRTLTSTLLFLFALLCLVRAGDYKETTNGNCTPFVATAPHKFSVCTMVHDEAKYVEEWVAYHLLIKVDHFYIYNDRSSDNIAEVLAPYIKQGLVSLIHWDNNQTVSPLLITEDPKFTLNQRFALGDCVINHASESEWFGIWDVDEFVSLHESYLDIPSFLSGYLANQEVDEYHIPMTIFGSAGHTTSPEGLVIENYQWRSNITMFGVHPYTEKFTGKTLYKSGCAVPEVHWASLLPTGCRLHYGWTKPGDTDFPMTLNHYFQKSWVDYEAKMAKWHWNANRTTFEKAMEQFSQVRDQKMMKYVSPLKNLQKCMWASTVA